MIIVDQEKNNLVRFENIVSIGISNYEGLQRITAETLGHAVALGDYKTEERAKEVLKEIIDTFSAEELNGTYDAIDLILKAKFMARYEMPKE